jgi:hypothetical protein
MKTAPKLLSIFAAAAALAGASTGCDIQTISSQATAKNVAVATLLVTPPVTVHLDTLPFDAGSFDGGGFDGGFTFDAGDLFADASVTIPSQNLVTVFFGERGASLETPPTGLPGATVTLVQAGGSSWPVPEVGGGNYTLFGDDAGFKYVDNATYTFNIVLKGTNYVAEVTQAPALEHISAFHPATNTINLEAGQPFSFTRPDPPTGQDRTLGFVTVFPISLDGGQGDPTWTNVPNTPLQFVKLALSPTEWKSAVVMVPGSAFPAPSSAYIIMMQSAKLGGPKSNNLFIGSAVLAGTTELGVVRTAP